jgi:hypothetical protein
MLNWLNTANRINLSFANASLHIYCNSLWKINKGVFLEIVLRNGSVTCGTFCKIGPSAYGVGCH